MYNILLVYHQRSKVADEASLWSCVWSCAWSCGPVVLCVVLWSCGPVPSCRPVGGLLSSVHVIGVSEHISAREYLCMHTRAGAS